MDFPFLPISLHRDQRASGLLCPAYQGGSRDAAAPLLSGIRCFWQGGNPKSLQGCVQGNEGYGGTGRAFSLLSKKSLWLQEKPSGLWDGATVGAGAAAVLLPLSKGFWFPLIYQIEGELGCAIFQLFLKNQLFLSFLSDVPLAGDEEEKRREILLRDTGRCCVPSARGRQRSMGRARSGFIVASRFSALAIFLSKQKPQKYLILLCCHEKRKHFLSEITAGAGTWSDLVWRKVSLPEAGKLE